MNPSAQLVREVYRRTASGAGWSLEQLARGEIRYYSFGRHALLAALRAIGAGSGDRVLVPAFICRDLLAAINAVGAEIAFYAVGKDLQLSDDEKQLPAAKAIIAVDYFGFPQALAPFKAYCQRTGAVLIEDNAHGLLSRDENGNALGARADYGIFSLRKTVPLPNGAALLSNDSTHSLPAQIPFSSLPAPRSYRIKRLLAQTVPCSGILPLRMLTLLGRVLRKWRTGYEIAPSPPEAETAMPEDAAPCADLLPTLAQLEVAHEIELRRALYRMLEPLVLEAGGEAVFSSLGEHTVPYVFPFRAGSEKIGKIRARLAQIGLECHPWPDLPDAVIQDAPEYYKTVWMVSFIW